MEISIFGMGYVGCVSAACLAKDGHKVIGVDTNPDKVALINSSKSPIVEAEIAEMISETVASKALRASTDSKDAVSQTNMSIVCVGTPSMLNGNLDLSYIHKVCTEIGAAIKAKSGYHIVVLRSTMLPGSMRGLVIPTLEASSGKRAGVDFGVCNNPEFLREGTAVYDYRNPPKTVIGETDTVAGDMLCELYMNLSAPLIRTELEVAEMVKYSGNVWHALKIAFANEIGNICKSVNIDSHKVMDIFCQDTKLNISPYYMKPGFAFGGSCLPKDLRALTYKARQLDVEVPVLNAILPSNQLQIKRAIELIERKRKKKLGFLGFAFKPGTDDLRESPILDLIEYFLGKGYQLQIFDKNVHLSFLTGANRNYLINHIPHISKIMSDNMASVIDFAEVVVIGNKAGEFKAALPSMASKDVVDLVRIVNSMDMENYDGICW